MSHGLSWIDYEYSLFGFSRCVPDAFMPTLAHRGVVLPLSLIAKTGLPCFPCLPHLEMCKGDAPHWPFEVAQTVICTNLIMLLFFFVSYAPWVAGPGSTPFLLCILCPLGGSALTCQPMCPSTRFCVPLVAICLPMAELAAIFLFSSFLLLLSSVVGIMLDTCCCFASIK